MAVLEKPQTALESFKKYLVENQPIQDHDMDINRTVDILLSRVRRAFIEAGQADQESRAKVSEIEVYKGPVKFVVPVSEFGEELTSNITLLRYAIGAVVEKAGGQSDEVSVTLKLSPFTRFTEAFNKVVVGFPDADVAIEVCCQKPLVSDRADKRGINFE
jgi:hypothetical protein